MYIVILKPRFAKYLFTPTALIKKVFTDIRTKQKFSMKVLLFRQEELLDMSF